LELIRERNRFDVALYEHASRLFVSAVSKQREEVSRIAAELKDARARSQGTLESTVFNVRAAVRKAANRFYSAI
jgi:hypothetical protein